MTFPRPRMEHPEARSWRSRFETSPGEPRSGSTGSGADAPGSRAVGATEGFGRSSRDFYQEHGQPKQLYLRELRPGDRRRLRQARLPEELALYEAELAGPCPFRAPALESLLDRLGALPDSRSGHGLRHRQRFVLACAAVCTLMGACGYRAFENISNSAIHEFAPRSWSIPSISSPS